MFVICAVSVGARCTDDVNFDVSTVTEFAVFACVVEASVEVTAVVGMLLVKEGVNCVDDSAAPSVVVCDMSLIDVTFDVNVDVIVVVVAAKTVTCVTLTGLYFRIKNPFGPGLGTLLEQKHLGLIVITLSPTLLPGADVVTARLCLFKTARSASNLSSMIVSSPEGRLPWLPYGLS